MCILKSLWQLGCIRLEYGRTCFSMSLHRQPMFYQTWWYRWFANECVIWVRMGEVWCIHKIQCWGLASWRGATHCPTYGLRQARNTIWIVRTRLLSVKRIEIIKNGAASVEVVSFNGGGKSLEVAMLVQNTNKETKGVLMYCGKSPQSHGSIYRVHIGGSGRVLPHTKPTIHLYLS